MISARSDDRSLTIFEMVMTPLHGCFTEDRKHWMYFTSIIDTRTTVIPCRKILQSEKNYRQTDRVEPLEKT